MAPRSAAASVGRKLAAPVMAAITQSAGRDAASTTASSPAPASIPEPASASFRSRCRTRIRDRRKTRADLARNRGQGRDIAMRGDRLDAIAAALPFQADRPCCAPIEPVAPRMLTERIAALAAWPRAGKRGVFTDHLTNQSSLARAHSIRRARRRSQAPRPQPLTNPSSRSITPPCPGMSAPESFALKIALHLGFEQVAGLRHDGQRDRDQSNRNNGAERSTARRPRRRPAIARDHPADRARPGLVRADRRARALGPRSPGR